MCVLLAVYIGLIIATPHSRLYIFGLRPVRVQTTALEPDIKQNTVLLVRKAGLDGISEGQYVSYRLDTLDGTADDVGYVYSVGGDTATISTADGAVTVPGSGINGYVVAKLSCLTPFASLAAGMPTLLLELILLVVIFLLVILGLFWVSKILSHSAAPDVSAPEVKEKPPAAEAAAPVVVSNTSRVASPQELGLVQARKDDPNISHIASPRELGLVDDPEEAERR